MTTFADQIAVVTGAGSGIGRAIALGLAGQGATVCLIGRGPEKLEAVAQSARASGVRAATYPTDLTLEDDIRQLADRLKRDFGEIDVLVHSAGIVRLGQIADAPATAFDVQYRTNLLAPYVLTQALLPMLRSRRGQVRVRQLLRRSQRQGGGSPVRRHQARAQGPRRQPSR